MDTQRNDKNTCKSNASKFYWEVLHVLLSLHHLQPRDVVLGVSVQVWDELLLTKGTLNKKYFLGSQIPYVSI